MAKLPSWMGGQEDDEEAGKVVEAKFGEMTKAAATEAVAGVSAKVDTLAEGIAAINKRYKDEDDERKAAKAKELRDQPVATAEEQFERFAADPAAFVREAALPATRLALQTAANQAKAEVLADKDYYHGALKSEVDALISAEGNLAMQANTSFIENCYLVVVGRHTSEIAAGDVKKKQAMHSFSDSQGSGRSSEDDNKVRVEWGNDNKMKYAAAQMGITEDDIVATAKDRAIRGLEVVA